MTDILIRFSVNLDEETTVINLAIIQRNKKINKLYLITLKLYEDDHPSILKIRGFS